MNQLLYQTSTTQENLLGALFGVARSTTMHPKTELTDHILYAGLASYLQNEEDQKNLINKIREEKSRIAPNCISCAAPCGNTADLNFEDLNRLEEPEKTLKFLLLRIIQGSADLLPENAFIENDCFSLSNILFLLGLERSPIQMKALYQKYADFLLDAVLSHPESESTDLLPAIKAACSESVSVLLSAKPLVISKNRQFSLKNMYTFILFCQVLQRMAQLPIKCQYELNTYADFPSLLLAWKEGVCDPFNFSDQSTIPLFSSI